MHRRVRNLATANLNFLKFSLLGAAFGIGIATPLEALHAQYAGAEPVPESYRVGFDSITKEQSQEWLSILAGPGFEGRGTGQLGYVKAAHWVAGKVAEFGLQPRGENGTYFQMLPMANLQVDSQQSLLAGPKNLSIPFEKNIGLDRFYNQAEIAGKLSIVKLVGDAPRIPSDSLQDRIVLCVADAQNEARVTSLLAAQRPAAILRVITSDPSSATLLKRNVSRGPRSIAGTVSLSAATLIANAASIPSEWLTLHDKSTTELFTTEADFKFQLRIREEPAVVPNVLAWLPGSDPNLADEYIVLGAHLDHLGIENGVVHPGADDNGSGSTALLNIAKAIGQNPVKPKRSVLLIWFAAEEKGLVGSAHYTDNPLMPIDKMICMLNIDMVGRNEEKSGETAEENETSLHLVGSQKGDKTLHDVILEANKYVNFQFEFDEEGVFGRSDQANFFKRGVSVAFLFGGFHPDYHKPTDDPAKINYQKIAAAAKLFYVTLFLATDRGFFKVPAEPAKTKEAEKPAEPATQAAAAEQTKPSVPPQ